MRNPLLTILETGIVTQRGLFPDLPEFASGLPKVTDSPCEGAACNRCVSLCPTDAITISDADPGSYSSTLPVSHSPTLPLVHSSLIPQCPSVSSVVQIRLDRGRCIGCGECLAACPTGTLVEDRSTATATTSREALVLSNRPPVTTSDQPDPSDRRPVRASTRPLVRSSELPFSRSLHIREVSTGCNATDLEVAAATNPIFDVARFGAHFVASPRFADALLVTGPVGLAMQEPLRRCYDAMADPCLVIAVGTCAISGGVHRGGYASANGVAEIIEPAVYVPGCPPHPWSIIHGILLAMGRY